MLDDLPCLWLSALFISVITEGEISLEFVFILRLSLDEVVVSQHFEGGHHVPFVVCSASFLPLPRGIHFHTIYHGLVVSYGN